MGRLEHGASSPALRFGANYVPSNGWFYSWLDFDADDVRRDLADLAGLGLDHVRVFPIWPWIQPNRSHIRDAGIADLLSTIDIAAEFGLGVAVDLIQGHLSSFDFLPSWTLTWHRRSVFEDRAVRDGLADYVGSVCRAVASRPNVFAVTLGNEVNNLFPANTVTGSTGRAWAGELLQVVGEASPEVLRIHSLHDEAFYLPGHPFDPRDATDLGDLTSVHSWVFTGVSAIDGPTGPASLSHADYLVELAAAMSLDPRRRIWLQEIGAPAPDIPADRVAEFTAGTLGLATENPALWGVTWWCSHDVDRSLVDFPEREYDLGLFTTDHRAKPAAYAVADVMAASRGRMPATPERAALATPHDLRAADLDRASYAPGSAFHAQWVELRASGPLAIVSAERCGDSAHLRARGISELILPWAGVDQAG